MDNTNWKLLRIKPETHNKLKLRAAQEGLSMGETIDRLLGAPTTPIATPDEAERLLEELDNKNERPEDFLSPEDRELFEQLEPGELPECCQEYYTNGTKCRHWNKEYVNYYGKRVIGYRNTLTGGTNYDYQTLYQQ